MEEEREKELAEKYRDRVRVCDKICKQLYIYQNTISFLAIYNGKKVENR